MVYSSLQGKKTDSGAINRLVKWNALYYFWQSRAATGPSKGRVNHHTTYIAKESNKEQWIQVDFGKVAKVTKIGTQGCYYQHYCHGEWVSKYTVSYSFNGEYFENQLQNSSNVRRVSWKFQSNVDRLSIILSWIWVERHPEEAQYFKIDTCIGIRTTNP